MGFYEMGSFRIGDESYEFPSIIRGLTPQQSQWITHVSQRLEGAYTSVKDCGAIGDGSTDDTAAINRAVTLATAASRHLHFPQGTYKVTGASLAVGAGAIAIPSNFLITGDGPLSVIKIVGQEDVEWNAFKIEDASSNIVFEALTFQGDNTPFEYVLNNQSAAIDIRLSASTDIIVRNCIFKNLWGFSVHDRGGNKRIHAINNWFIECANGLNINSHYSVQSGNVFYKSEGIEAAGSHTLISNNSFYQPQGVGISVGGNTGAGAKVTGIVVSGNSIVESTACGIVLADGLEGAAIVGNTMRKNTELGLTVSTSVNPVRRCQFVGNSFFSNGATGIGSVGMDLGSTGSHVIIGNTFVNESISGYDQKYGLIVRCPTNIVAGNHFNGSLHDVSFNGASATGSQVFGNVYANGTEEFVNGGVAGNFTTKGKALALGGIGVGNSAAANTAVGTLVRKIEVFDASGASLGFIPVYSSIS
jgi:hypothetical protein